MKLKTYFKFTMLFMAMAFMVAGCQKEDDTATASQTVNERPSLNITIAPWELVEGKNGTLSDKVDRLRKGNVGQRTGSSHYGFHIDEEQVQVIENDGFTTYTFLAITDIPEPNTLLNYMFKANSDGTYEQYLLRYRYAINGQGEIVYGTDIAGIEPMDDDGLVLGRAACVPEFVEVLDDIVCTDHTTCTGAANHTSSTDPQCECEDTPQTCYRAGTSVCELQYVFVYQGCGGGNGGTGTSDPDNTTGGGGSSPTEPYEVIVAVPNMNLATTLIEIFGLDKTADAELISWIRDHYQTLGAGFDVTEIFNFLFVNGFSEEAVDISYEVAMEQYFIDNPNDFIELLDINQDIAHPIENIDEYLDCFNDGKTVQNYGYIMYVDQPVDGTRKVFNYSEQTPGHTFFTLFKNNVDGTSVNLTIGFYPKDDSYKDLSNWDGPGIFQNNGYPGDEHVFDIYITFDDITQNQFNGIIEDIQEIANSDYDLDDNNCTNVAHNLAVEHLGFNMTPNTSDIPILPGAGECINPGDYGEDLREMMNDSNSPYSNNIGIPIDGYNNATTSNGPCN